MHPPDPDTRAAHLATTPITLPGFHEPRFDQLSPAGRLDAWRACERLARAGGGHDAGVLDPGWMPHSSSDAGDGLPDYFLQHPNGLLPGDDAPWIFDPGAEQGQPGDYPDLMGDGGTEIA